MYQTKKSKKSKSKKQTNYSYLIPFNVLKTGRILAIFDSETIGQPNVKKSVQPFDSSVIFIDITKIDFTKEKITRKDILNAIVDRVSLINSTIFDNSYLRDNIFYGDKIPFYNQMLNPFNQSKNKKYYSKQKDLEIVKTLDKLFKKYHITTLFAFNSSFDVNALNNLYQLVNKTHKTNYKMVRFNVDIRKYIIDYYIDNEEERQEYISFCDKHDLVVRDLNGVRGKNYQTNVESFTHFENKHTRYKEHHTGLRDAIDEALLFVQYVKKRLDKKQDTSYQLNSIVNVRKCFYPGGLFNLLNA